MKRCKNKGIGDFSHSLIFAYSVRLCNMKMNILTQSVEELPIERERVGYEEIETDTKKLPFLFKLREKRVRDPS